MFWRIFLFILCYWILAAHFLRSGDVIVTGVIALAPLAIFIKHQSIKLFLQLGLVVGVFTVWLPTIYNIASMRMAMDQPWLRMALILSAVCVLSFFSAWAVQPVHRDK